MVKYVLKSASPPKPKFDLTRELNPQQRAVVEAPAAKILVLAGAGTGKTRTLTYRVARLVAGGCPPERIMLVTFTNRAAREMVSRVENLLGIDMRRSAAGTFHHVGNRILRRHGEALGLGSDFGILDPEDARDLMTSVIQELGMPVLTTKRFPNAKILIKIASQATGMLATVGSVVERRFLKFLDMLEPIKEVVANFAERKRRLNCVDFDDLLALWLELLRNPKHREIAERLRSGWQHLLVDEYQDINALQGALIDEMAQVHQSLTCVGDDAQSIYSFRGADFAQIHDFRIRHRDAQVLPLTINYRSTPEILALANRSIAVNRLQHPKQLQAVRPPGMLPALIPLRDTMQQAELVAQRVLELHHDQNLPLRKMAVLYRNHAHSLELQVELTRRGIPFAVRSGLRFFEQAHIKDVVAYLRARENPRDALAWLRLLRLWPGVGNRTAERVAGVLSGELDAHGQPDQPDLSAAGAATQAPAGATIPELLAREAEHARGRAKDALAKLAGLFEKLSDGAERSPGRAIRLIVADHYRDYADRTFTNADARKEDLDNLATFAERWPEAGEFLSELALVQGMTAENVVVGEEPDDKLVLSTIHQAKGLEWPIVFVLWLAEGRFPTAQSLRSASELEEERRLFYVAATRAADELYMLYPTIEEGRDGPSKLLRPSRFVAEIEHQPAVFERWEIEEVPRDD
ncbi:ATP-dependent DNA helicase PcrA [Enhygromyxa salina]|uniref:DNA 3'-5' helicase n=1 Tax=Enhygromyxa salina TaxID=215803 RepID=A0A2S9YF04_9BACT|nr:ATP-dependent helicase [Enhygromyxa salina]PRQ03698.1 ATP-dependent DNA helicase PcrA [Enhygromyxa salina]